MNCYSKDCQFRNNGYGDILKCICSACPNRVYEQYAVVTSNKTLSEKELEKEKNKYKDRYEIIKEKIWRGHFGDLEDTISEWSEEDETNCLHG